jgi:FHA domain
VVGERPLFKGVLVIGREDRRSTVVPDVKLFDPGNTVSRGCHAWLHVYTDPGTGAEYNTFVIHNNSPAGILVDGQRVMESVAIGESAEIRIGVFRMEIRKETPTASVQF